MFTEQAEEFLTAIAPHMVRLVAYARLVAGNRAADAEELLHDAILICHGRIEKRGFTGCPDAYVGYLFVMIRHTYQEQREQAQRQVLLQQMEFVPDTAEQPEPERIDPRTMVVTVKTFVHHHYPPAWEQVFELHCQGLSYSEIHFATGVVKSTAQQQVQRIKADLRKEFGWVFED